MRAGLRGNLPYGKGRERRLIRTTGMIDKNQTPNLPKLVRIKNKEELNLKAMRSFLENAPSGQNNSTHQYAFFIYWDRLMKIDTALYSNEKRHRQLWYVIVDTILSMSHPDTFVGSYIIISPGLYVFLET